MVNVSDSLTAGATETLITFNTKDECEMCCPYYRSDTCPESNITLCQKPVNTVTGQCLGGPYDEFKNEKTGCGTACPIICKEPPPKFCIEM